MKTRCLVVPRSLPAGLLFSLLLFVVQYASGAPQAILFLTSQSENGIPGVIPEEEFDCAQKIFAVIDFSGFPTGRHRLVGTWFRADKKREQVVRYSFYSTGKSGRVWVWLQLFRPAGTDRALERFLLGNPASGMEDFVGQWRIQVRLGSAATVNGRFVVSC